MKISFRGWLLVAFIGALIAGLAVWGPAAVKSADAAQTDQSRLDVRGLGGMLQSIGLQPTLEQQRYDFNFKAKYNENEWELSMSAVLSQNGESVWVMAWLDELPRSAADVPRTALLRLLAENDRMGNGKFFTYIPGNRRFVLQRVVPNQNLTTADLRGVLQDVGASVVETYDIWTVESWKRKPTEQEASQTPSSQEKSTSSNSPGAQTRRLPSRSASNNAPPAATGKRR